MKAKLAIYFCVTLWPSIICDENLISGYMNDVTNIAREGGQINGLFEPKGVRVLGRSHRDFVFPGTLHPSTSRTDIWRSGEREIAMKFTIPLYEAAAKTEYEMYSYLDAIGNENVEIYGIPTVYYYGTWHENNDLIMLGISLLEQTIEDLTGANAFVTHKSYGRNINILIILRNFILSTKYMHSRGVAHNQIESTNIMVRKDRSFIIDFNTASKMENTQESHILDARRRMNDWRGFLYAICYCVGAPFDWNSPNCLQTLNNIKSIRSEILKNIFFDLAIHVGRNETPSSSASIKEIPDYDRFYELVNKGINKEIKKSRLPKPAMFTWLTNEQRNEAIAALSTHMIPDITEIRDPLND